MLVLALVIGAAALATAAPPADPCSGLLDVDMNAPPRPVIARDLVELTDIGRADPYDYPGLFGVSPDQKQIAFVTRRANPDVNQYCQRLMVMPLDGRTQPRELDRGGALIRTTLPIWSIAALPQGTVATVAPQWSRDGQHVAYLKRVGGSTQVWLAGLGDKAARQMTHLPDDVEDFAWTADGTALILAHRPGLRGAGEGIAREGLQGWLYDDRFSPMEASHPFARLPIATVYDRLSLVTNQLAPASKEEAASIGPKTDPDHPVTAQLFVRDDAGNRAWTTAAAPELYLSPTKLVLNSARGAGWTCTAPECDHIQHLWWSRPGRLIFMSRSGWGSSETGLYSWQIGTARPRRIMVTPDALIGCEMAGAQLICAEETSASPRAIVSIDTDTGDRRAIYEPNKGWSHLQLGSIQRIELKNSYGIESFADLVLPPSHHAGDKHPLVVVQYSSRGFLRGGTGDEVPIQLLASRGFAVLSFDKPGFYALTKAPRTEREFRTINYSGWMDRRSIVASLEEAVQRAIATGTVDPQRIGISGFSDGVETVQYALINSPLFSVAAIGGCCNDQMLPPLVGGPGYQRHQTSQGLPAFDAEAKDYWGPMSLHQHADRLHTPILAQATDSEYTLALDVEAAWRERGNPFELYVFPDETHVKWQPAHRLAIYERVSDWFSFWLMHKMDCNPAKRGQYDRWFRMKGAPGRAASSCMIISPIS